jgi:Tol biopolymer transport system component
VTDSGALFVWKFERRFYVQVAPIDLNLGKPSSDPAGSFREAIRNGGKPVWSPDGKYLAYRSCSEPCNSTETIRIRAMDTGRIRELPIRDPLQYLMGPPDIVWSSNGGSLFVRARDLKGTVGDFRIDAQTGEISANTASGGSAPQELVNLTLDGTKRYDAAAGSIVERELASGKERVVFQERAPGNSILLTSSPDRQYTAFIETTSNKASTLFVMPFGGGEPKELLRGTAFDAFGRNGMTWTPDNRAILLLRANGQHKELWLVPVADGAPRKLDIDVDNWQVGNVEGGFRMRPDGREIAFVAGEVIDEVRAIENFLPVTGAKK